MQPLSLQSSASDLPATSMVLMPWVVEPDTPVLTAIALMAGTLKPPTPRADALSRLTSCVVVVEQERVVGILTQGDVVRLLGQGTALAGVAIATVMTTPVKTLRRQDLLDMATATAHLQHHNVSHLPLVDGGDRLLGVITYESLWCSQTPLEHLSHRLTLAMRAGGIGCWDADLEANQAFWDPRTCEIYGIPPHGDRPITFQDWVGSLHPEDRPQIEAAVAAAIASPPGQPLFLEFRIIRPDGQVRYVQQQAIFLPTPPDRLPQVVGITSDTTQRKQAELALKNSEHRFRSIFDANLVGMFFADFEGHITEVNDYFLAMLGYDRPEFEQQGLNWQQLTPPEYAYQDQAMSQALQQQGILNPVEKTYFHRDGHRVPVLIGAALLSQEGAGNCVCVVVDLSDRKATESALRESEGRLQQLASVVDAVFWVVAPDRSDRIYVSPAYERIWGRPCADLEIDPYTWLEAIDPNDRPAVEAAVPQQALGNYDMEYRIHRPDGETRWIRDRAFPIRNETGEVYRLAGIAEDITPLKTAEQERQTLLQQLSAFKLALDESAIVAITDAQGMITYANDRFVLVSGYSRAELLGQTHRLVNSGCHPPEFFHAMWSTILRGEVWRGEICNQAKDRRLYWVDSTIVPFLNDQGKPEQFLAVRFDITPRKRAELDLKQSYTLLSAISRAQAQFITATNRLVIFEELLNTLLEMTQSEYGFIGEVFFRGDGTATMEESFMKIRGIPYLKTHSITNIAWDEETQNFYENNYEKGMEFTNMSTLFGAVIMTGQPVIANSPSTDSRRGGIPHGHPPLLAFLGLPFFQGETLMGMVGIANRPGGYDPTMVEYLQPFLITCSNLIEGYRIDRQRRIAETQLQQANQELLRATRLKDEFLANMSHELRTPLNAILGMAEGLQEAIFGEINYRQRKALETIASSGSHLLELINDILDVAKIESGQIDLEYATLDLQALGRSSLAFVKQQAMKKGIQLTLAVDPQLPPLSGDERRLRQVLINLLNNAVKFTPEGGSVTLEGMVVSAPSQGTVPQVRLQVQDSGIGIPPEHLDKLFQPFIQIDSALNRQYAGTGLGLALVKRIVQLHGGDVGVSSQVGQGSLFWIDLPLTIESRPVQLEPPSPNHSMAMAEVIADIQPPLILLAEDNEANISTISSYLGAKGYHLSIARNGQEAVAKIAEENPDLVLMDIQMPEMDGIEAIQYVRKVLQRQTLPIIALTALAMDEDRDRCLTAGANTYLSKPVKLKELVTTIQGLLSGDLP